MMDRAVTPLFFSDWCSIGKNGLCKETQNKEARFEFASRRHQNEPLGYQTRHDSNINARSLALFDICQTLLLRFSLDQKVPLWKGFCWYDKPNLDLVAR